MSEKKWTEISEEMSVAFSLPCREHYYHVRRIGTMSCDKPDERHGHIELMCDDGYGLIYFCCYSQAGVKTVVKAIGEEEFKGILDLEEVKKLPQELTEEEKLVIASPVEMEKFTKIYGWWS